MHRDTMKTTVTKCNRKIHFLVALWNIHSFINMNFDRRYLTEILPIRLGDYSTNERTLITFHSFSSFVASIEASSVDVMTLFTMDTFSTILRTF